MWFLITLEVNHEKTDTGSWSTQNRPDEQNPTGEKNRICVLQHLEQRKRAGEIVWYRFEGIKLRLADNTFYTPDFAVMLATGEMELHEVKGFWTDDARVKTKVAADQYPFRIIGVTVKPKKAGGGWNLEEF